MSDTVGDNPCDWAEISAVGGSSAVGGAARVGSRVGGIDVDGIRVAGMIHGMDVGAASVFEAVVGRDSGVEIAVALPPRQARASPPNSAIKKVSRFISI